MLEGDAVGGIVEFDSLLKSQPSGHTPVALSPQALRDCVNAFTHPQRRVLSGGCFGNVAPALIGQCD